MTDHVLSEGGKKLYLFEGNDFTAVILNSGMFKTAITETLTAGLSGLYASYAKKMFICGSANWHTDSCTYILSTYQDNENGDEGADVQIAVLANGKNDSETQTRTMRQ